eukprot:CAMPEP_0119529624 /NCGR_PEP_ID=MMETSP1344-20130328/43601_1 /TAXON_ID=236787 /ORGANISM="Florenciella parvula, Strain CCMP2471" /LENGTH=248 /DNA_ID=CAMNT_0007569301 /DNA_START=16 /DNA_END=762 /DNA_ORIENTATION=-
MVQAAPKDVGIDMTGLYIALAIGFLVIGSVIMYGLKEATKAKGYKKAAKKIDTSVNLDKQKAEADAANRAFKASLDEVFDSIDKDGNGKLTRRELKNGLKSSDVVMEAIGCKRLKDGMKFFEDADKNGDGELTKDEFVNYVKGVEAEVDDSAERRAKGQITQADMDIIKGAYEKMDPDHSNSITKDELAVVFASIAEAKGKKVNKTTTTRWVAKILRRFDADHDGTISFDEFVPMCLRGPFAEIFDKH